MSQDHAGRQSAGPAERPALVPALRTPLGVVAMLGALLVAVPAVVFAGDAGPGELDRRIRSVVDDASAGWRQVALVVDFLGEPVGVVLSMAVVAGTCLIFGRRRLAVLAVAGTSLAGATTALLKPVVQREIHGEFLSYPSGHTAALAALALVVALLLADLLSAGTIAGTVIIVGGALLGGFAMAWAQVVLDAHYPTDTLGGFGVALVVVPAVAWLIDWAAVRIG